MTPHQQVIDLIGKLKTAVPNNATVERLTDEIATLVMAHAVPTVGDDFQGLHLSRSELRIVEFLRAKQGRVASKEAIMGALYFDKPGDEPDLKIVDVFVCRVRRKLEHSVMAIRTSWGHGYCWHAFANLAEKNETLANDARGRNRIDA